MEYNITLNAIQYIFVLCTFGAMGSCYQAYRTANTIRPFIARIVTGCFSGAITMLVVYRLGMEQNQPLIHWGVAAILGAIMDKKEGNNFVEKFIMVLGKGEK